MNWLLLIIAGLFEVGFATCLGKAREAGSNTALWMTGFFVCRAISMLLMGILFFKEPADFWRLFFITLLIGSIIGLKAVSSH